MTLLFVYPKILNIQYYCNANRNNSIILLPASIRTLYTYNYANAQSYLPQVRLILILIVIYYTVPSLNCRYWLLKQYVSDSYH